MAMYEAVFHFNLIVMKRSVFHCFVSTQAEPMTRTQWNTLRFAAILGTLKGNGNKNFYRLILKRLQNYRQGVPKKAYT